MTDSSRVGELRRRIQRDPTSLIFAQLAEEHRRAGEHQEAVRVCLAGLRHHPEYHSARVTLGRSLLALGQLDEAEQEFYLVLGAAPGNLLARRELGELYLRTDRLTEALEQLRAAQALAPQDPDLAATVAELEQEVRPGAPAAPGEQSASTAEEASATEAAASVPYVIGRRGEPPSALVEPVTEAEASEQAEPAASALQSPSIASDAAHESEAPASHLRAGEAEGASDRANGDAGLEGATVFEAGLEPEGGVEQAAGAEQTAGLEAATSGAALAPPLSHTGTAVSPQGQRSVTGRSTNGLMSRLERWLAAIERTRQGRNSSH